MSSIWKIAIILLIMSIPFIFWQLPLDISSAQKITLGIVLMSLVFWISEAIPLYATGLVILIFEIVFLSPFIKTTYPDFSLDKFYAPYFSDTIALFLGGLLLAKAFEKYDLDKWIISWVIRKAGSSASRILLYLIFTVAILSMWISNTAAAALGLILIYRLQKNITEHSQILPFVLGVPFAANLGGMATPVGTPPNAIVIALLRKNGVDISFAKWMLYALPLTVVVLFALWFFLRLRYRLPEKINIPEIQEASPLDLSARFILGAFFLALVLWLSSSWHNIPDGIVALIPATIFLSLGYLDRKDFKSISWDILFLVGGGMALSVALTETGTGKLLANSIDISGLSLLITAFLFSVMGVLLSNSMSNTATANILFPIVILSFTGDTLFPFVAISMSISSAMSLPISTPPNAIAYSSDMVPLKEMIKTGSISSLLSLATIFLPGYIWITFLDRFIL